MLQPSRDQTPLPVLEYAPLDGIPTDRQMVARCRQIKASLAKPIHSDFRVVALIVFEDEDGHIQAESGSNWETACLTGAICAERTALCKIRERRPKRVLRVAIATDSTGIIYPGPLCREFLSENMAGSTQVLLACEPEHGEASPDPKLVVRLEELYPFPSQYAHVPRARAAAFAAALGDKVEPPPAHMRSLFDACAGEAKRLPSQSVHPIHYAAGVRFRSGKVFCSGQWHAMEYGGSVDAIARLSSWIEREMDTAAEDKSGDFPESLVMLDQYGVAHAPFSFGRTYLIEAGFGSTEVWFHGPHGRLQTLEAKDLLPQHAPIKDVLVGTLAGRCSGGSCKCNCTCTRAKL